MPTDHKVLPFRYDHFEGGVNNKLHATLIPDNTLADLQDGDISTPGIVAVRSGYTQVGGTATTGKTVQGLIHTYQDGAFNGGNRKIIIVDSDTSGQKLWYWDGVNPIAQLQKAGPANAILTNFVSGGKVKSIQIPTSGAPLSVIIFQNDTGLRPYVYGMANGTLAQEGTANTNITPAQAMAFWHGRLWNALRSGDESGVWFSGVYNLTFDETLQKLIPGLHRGSRTRAIGPLRNSEFIIFCDNGIYRIHVEVDPFGLASFGFPIIESYIPEELDVTVGCIATETVAVIGTDMFFMDQYANVRSLQRTALDAAQGTKSLPVSDPIQAYIDRINLTQVSKSRAIVYNNRYYLSVPMDGSTTNNKTLVFDVTLNAWLGIWNVGFSNFVVSDVEGTTYLYGSKASDTDLKLYRLESGTSDNGVAIAFSMTSKRHFFQDYDREKVAGIFVADYVSTTDSTVTHAYSIDGGGFASMGTVNLEGSPATLPQMLPFNLGGAGITPFKVDQTSFNRFHDIQYRITSPDLNANFQLLGYRTEARLFELKGID